MTISTIIVLLIGAITTTLVAFMQDWQTKLMGLAVLLGCIAYLVVKIELSKRHLQELQRLKTAFDQLDQQAKLIIRTDFELHQTQEELDRRLASLMSLHQLAQRLRASLRPEEVYAALEDPVVTSLGFTSGLLGLCAATTVEWRSQVATAAEVSDAVKRHLEQSGLLAQLLALPQPKILEQASAPDPAWQELFRLLNAPTLALAPVTPEAGPPGCLILARTGAGGMDLRAAQELVGLLVSQLAAAVENSALYEAAWSSKRELERKVQERTQELAQANEQLIRLNRAKSDFVSAVSHELRTPLAAIKGYASLLRTGQFGALAAAQEERLAKIEKHSDALTQLINNLLDIARIESGRMTMERRPISTEELLGTVQELVKPQLDAKHLHLVVKLDGVKQLQGDAQHLQRVFMNLLSNAVKYTPDKGTITVEAAREGAQVAISVTDTGRGISAEDLPKLFQEFYRASDPINQEIRGTGLGLALAKRIVEAHHGQMRVASTFGQGSTFTVTLPAEA